ncbi:MAG: hypothetical protein OEW99_14195 [Gammaproteobacteria bacterium]|nr:hypothetical protein [Gammaproteobacteria bacterium]
MNYPQQTSAELFIATGCSHCPVVLNELSAQLKKGHISSLTITNIAVDNKRAEELGIRSVPWFSLKNEYSFMIFSGNYTPNEIQQWIGSSQNKNGMQEYIKHFLSTGQLVTVSKVVQLFPENFSSVISLIKDKETNMDIRIGLDALIESLSGSEILKKYTSSLKEIASSNIARLQIDALHYIALTGDVRNKEFLQEKTKDKDQQVQDAAVEALETLDDLISKI